MGGSERFACRVTGQNRTTQRREPTATTVADPDAAMRAWLRAWAKTHPRRGFRNAYHDARGEGWAVDFQFDATTDGRPIKIVFIVDEHTRECLGGLVERSVTGEDLIDELSGHLLGGTRSRTMGSTS